MKIYADFRKCYQKDQNLTEFIWYPLCFFFECSNLFKKSYGTPYDFFSNWEFFFRGGGCRPSSKMSNIFGCTCPNCSGVGAIDNPDRFEQAFDTYYLTEVSEKIFTDGILMNHPQKMYSFCVLKEFYKQLYLL